MTAHSIRLCPNAQADSGHILKNEQRRQQRERGPQFSVVSGASYSKWLLISTQDLGDCHAAEMENGTVGWVRIPFGQLSTSGYGPKPFSHILRFQCARFSVERRFGNSGPSLLCWPHDVRLGATAWSLSEWETPGE